MQEELFRDLSKRHHQFMRENDFYLSEEHPLGGMSVRVFTKAVEIDVRLLPLVLNAMKIVSHIRNIKR